MNKGTDYAFVESNMSEDMKENKEYYKKRYNASDFDNFDVSTADTNESVHMRYVLTYSKNSAGSGPSLILQELLQPAGLVFQSMNLTIVRAVRMMLRSGVSRGECVSWSVGKVEPQPSCQKESAFRERGVKEI